MYSDRSLMAVFGDELSALRYAIEKRMDYVAFRERGEIK